MCVHERFRFRLVAAVAPPAGVFSPRLAYRGVLGD